MVYKMSQVPTAIQSATTEIPEAISDKTTDSSKIKLYEVGNSTRSYDHIVYEKSTYMQFLKHASEKHQHDYSFYVNLEEDFNKVTTEVINLFREQLLHYFNGHKALILKKIFEIFALADEVDDKLLQLYIVKKSFKNDDFNYEVTILCHINADTYDYYDKERITTESSENYEITIYLKKQQISDILDLIFKYNLAIYDSYGREKFIEFKLSPCRISKE